MDVDLSKPAVYQVWPEIRGILRAVNRNMKVFLSRLGIEEGNGLSQLTNDIATPDDMLARVIDMFKPPKRDPRDSGASGNKNTDDINDSAEVEEVNRKPQTAITPAREEIVRSFVEDVASSADEAGTKVVSENSVEQPVRNDPYENVFSAEGKSGSVYKEFKTLAKGEIASPLKLIQLIQLGKFEQGFSLKDGKFKSMEARWFGTKQIRTERRGVQLIAQVLFLSFATHL